MKRIICFLLAFVSVSFAEGFIPSPNVGDNWLVRREIADFDNLEKNTKRVQYWRYEVINKIEFNKEEILIILISSKDVNANIKLQIIKEKFILKEANYTSDGLSDIIELEEVIAPVIEINKMARLYDLPAFPLIDPKLASENAFTLPNGEKRIRKVFTRHHSSRGEVVKTELIWQETDLIKKENIKIYTKNDDDYVNKVNEDGYFLTSGGEIRKIKQIWVDSIPWWIYNESVYEKDYLVDYKSGGSGF